MSPDDELGRFEEASEPKDYRWQVAHIWITFTEPGFHVQPAWSCDGVLCRCVAGGGSAHGTRARTRADALCHAVLTIYCSGVVAGRRRCVSMALARHCATSLLMLIDRIGYAVLLELAHLEWFGYTSMGPRILVRGGFHCYVGYTHALAVLLSIVCGVVTSRGCRLTGYSPRNTRTAASEADKSRSQV